MMRFSSLLLFSLITFCASSFGQVITDTAFVQAGLKHAARQYHNFIGVNSGLINGYEYRQPKSNEEQHPFFMQADWMPGSIVYNGERYDNVSLIYDINGDHVVLESHINGQEIQMVKAKVSTFTIGEYVFTHIAESQTAGLTSAGFYEVLYDGQSRVLARHIKTFDEKIESNKLVFYYTPRTRYYIKKGEQYVRVVRKSDVLKIFKDKNNELRAFMRQNQIRLSRHNSRPLAVIAAHYDTLITSE